MSGNEEEEQKGGESWKNEHDAIQIQLKEMKEQFLKDTEFLTKPKPEPEPKPQKEPEPEQKPSEKSKHSSEMSIKEMFRSGLYKAENEIEEEESLPPARATQRERKEPPRLEEGKIPVAPNLTEKIANVIQLEDKLKRRKYELEKKQAQSKVPPPPISPVPRSGIQGSASNNKPPPPQSVRAAEPGRTLSETSGEPQREEGPQKIERPPIKSRVLKNEQVGSREKLMDQGKPSKQDKVERRQPEGGPPSSTSKEEKKQEVTGETSPTKDRAVEKEMKEEEQRGGAWKKLKGLFSK
ncbi:MAG: hypothetical protein ACMUIE_08245 [Thermoplasmatota archaeon]